MGNEGAPKPNFQKQAERCKAAMQAAPVNERVFWMARIKKLSEGFELSPSELAELEKVEKNKAAALESQTGNQDLPSDVIVTGKTIKRDMEQEDVPDAAFLSKPISARNRLEVENRGGHSAIRGLGNLVKLRDELQVEDKQKDGNNEEIPQLSAQNENSGVTPEEKKEESAELDIEQVKDEASQLLESHAAEASSEQVAALNRVLRSTPDTITASDRAILEALHKELNLSTTDAFDDEAINHILELTTDGHAGPVLDESESVAPWPVKPDDMARYVNNYPKAKNEQLFSQLKAKNRDYLIEDGFEKSPTLLKHEFGHLLRLNGFDEDQITTLFRGKLQPIVGEMSRNFDIAKKLPEGSTERREKERFAIQELRKLKLKMLVAAADYVNFTEPNAKSTLLPNLESAQPDVSLDVNISDADKVESNDQSLPTAKETSRQLELEEWNNTKFSDGLDTEIDAYEAGYERNYKTHRTRKGTFFSETWNKVRTDLTAEAAPISSQEIDEQLRGLGVLLIDKYMAGDITVFYADYERRKSHSYKQIADDIRSGIRMALRQRGSPQVKLEVQKIWDQYVSETFEQYLNVRKAIADFYKENDASLAAQMRKQELHQALGVTELSLIEAAQKALTAAMDKSARRSKLQKIETTPTRSRSVSGMMSLFNEPKNEPVSSRVRTADGILKLL